MRIDIEEQLQLGQTAIGNIRIDPNCNDDTPVVIRGLQFIFRDRNLLQAIFELLITMVFKDVRLDTGRPGMALWRILVIALVRHGTNCDYDRLHHMVNEDGLVRRALGHGKFDDTEYGYRTLVRNVSLLSEDVIRAINTLLCKAGHELLGHAEDQPLSARVDSFVVETDVHFPTDVNLLWDSMRCLLRVTGAACKRFEVVGWRQWLHLTRKVKKLFNRVRSARQWKKHPGRVRAYLAFCQALVERAERTLETLVKIGAGEEYIGEIRHFLAHAKRQMDHVERRILKGETIAHEEKVFSIFEAHTRWCPKGKAGVPVELGVPVCVLEDEHPFILDHIVMWNESDVDVAVPIVDTVLKDWPNLASCSFDKGFHSPANQEELAQRLELHALPRKGRLSRAAAEHEASAEFAAARRRHPAVESAINNLEQRGLDRVLSYGPEGFTRSVALGILAANVHRIGRLLRHRELERLKRMRKRAA